MIINIGSTNEIKIESVRETLSEYKMFQNSILASMNINSSVSEQPKSLEETIRGAINRSNGVFYECDYSFGIESGLMEVPYTKTGYMDLCACVIHDGKENHLGLSCAFELPMEVMRLIREKNYDINQAFYELKLTNNPKVGSDQGAIGILTNGRVTRKEYTKQAIRMALIHLENF